MTAKLRAPAAHGHSSNQNNWISNNLKNPDNQKINPDKEGFLSSKIPLYRDINPNKEGFPDIKIPM